MEVDKFRALFYVIVPICLILIGEGNAVQVIYITPNSIKEPCPDHYQPCFTLSELACKGLRNLSQSIELVVLPGKHDLKCSIVITNVTDFSLHSSSTFEVSQITCRTKITNLNFELITKVRIVGLKFVGCGNNAFQIVGNLTIKHSKFLGRNGSGTALIVNKTNTDIVNTTFDSNVVGTLRHIINRTDVHVYTSSLYYVGGAVFGQRSVMHIRDSQFVRNHANDYGGAIFIQLQSNITLINTTFTENSVCFDSKRPNTCYGGAISVLSDDSLYRSQLSVINSTFTHNRAHNGAVLTTLNIDIDIRFSFLNNNDSPLIKSFRSYSGSILNLGGDSYLIINGSVFSYNSGDTVIQGGKSITLVGSHFQSNKGYLGSIFYATIIGTSLIIRRCYFLNNSASEGGVLRVKQCNVTIEECEFNGNHINAELNHTLPAGGVILSKDSYITINKTIFTNNRAENGDGGVLELATNVSLIVDTCIFLYNQAQHGGAIDVFQSIILFKGKNYIMGNFALSGGGLYVSDNSVLEVNGELVISNNTVSHSGGGTILSGSTLKCEHSCTLRYNHNKAVISGGGIYAYTSTIVMIVERASKFIPSILFIHNNAELGGGMYLVAFSRILIKKSGIWFIQSQHSLFFANNSADYGGALFVSDKTCLFDTECFFQVLSNEAVLNHINSTDAIEFVGNSASEAGSVLFGGLLDRCGVNVAAEVIAANDKVSVDGITYFKNVSMMSGNNGSAISSLPVRVCLCINGQPDCTGALPTIEVKKGETFSVPVVAVNQVNQSHVFAGATITIYAQLSHATSGLGVGQLAQVTGENCSKLKFNIYSPFPSEELTLYAAGPCRNALESTLKLTVVFKECICPVGFYHNQLEIDNCMCDCDPQLLSKFITSCDFHKQTVTRHGNSWISYWNTTNDTNQYSYLTYPYCPLDYCLPLDTNVEINLNVPDGSDVQCRNNRSGLLCGVCCPGLSVSIGTSLCIYCRGNHDLVWLILLFILAGVVLVAVLLTLNMTVATGTINGVVFYANIVGCTSSIFFPTSSTKPVYVIVSWLNLDLGFDACFVDGLDTYMKTWIQMAFPTYIIFLLIIMIIWSECSLRLSKIIGKRNPVALLATLIFLSYAKFLSTIIAALFFIRLEYPGGSHKIVWFPDASVDYFSAKHLALLVVAVVILLVGIVYTVLLLFWQWVRKWVVGKINHKFCLFFDMYQAPYKLKHRYWPGLLLLARVILYLLFSLNQSGDPRVNLIGIIIVMCSLLLFKGMCGCVYENQMIDRLEIISFINITAFSAVQLYTLQSSKPQTISAFLSVSITGVLLVIVVSYHIYTAILIKVWHKYNSRSEHTQYYPVTQNRHQVNKMRSLLNSTEANAVTTTVVEFPSTRSSCDSINAVNSESVEDSCSTADCSNSLLI